jgi:hypothetical protein
MSLDWSQHLPREQSEKRSERGPRVRAFLSFMEERFSA